ncbi:uncharacterized protein LOC116253054 [Nymphaea colorata]|nr:uncharacterized protein LOC116253054 [Nymphaea colorata]
MYPRVRVRVEDDDPASDAEVENQLPLEKFKSIPVESFCSDGNGRGTDCPQYYAMAPKSYPTLKVCSTISSTPTSEDKQNQEKNVENKPKHDQENSVEGKPQIRASLVPRPRAVLSSPVNDQKIGSKNQLSQSKRPVLKKNEPSQNPVLQEKVNPRRTQSQSSVSSIKGARASVTTTRTRKKDGSEPKTSKQEAFTGKAKPRTLHS